jgi:hypothetical protein
MLFFKKKKAEPIIVKPKQQIPYDDLKKSCLEELKNKRQETYEKYLENYQKEFKNFEFSLKKYDNFLSITIKTEKENFTRAFNLNCIETISFNEGYPVKKTGEKCYAYLKWSDSDNENFAYKRNDFENDHEIYLDYYNNNYDFDDSYTFFYKASIPENLEYSVFCNYENCNRMIYNLRKFSSEGGIGRYTITDDDFCSFSMPDLIILDKIGMLCVPYGKGKEIYQQILETKNEG